MRLRKLARLVPTSRRSLRRIAAGSSAYATSSQNLSLMLTAYQGSGLRKALDGDVTLFNLAIDYLEDGYAVLRQTRGHRWDGIPELGRVNCLAARWRLVFETHSVVDIVQCGGRSRACK